MFVLANQIDYIGDTQGTRHNADKKTEHYAVCSWTEHVIVEKVHLQQANWFR